MSLKLKEDFMAKNKVTYHIKDDKNRLIEKTKILKDAASACNFFQTIKNISVLKPIIEEVKK
jgi:hypothetical protein